MLLVVYRFTLIQFEAVSVGSGQGRGWWLVCRRAVVVVIIIRQDTAYRWINTPGASVTTPATNTPTRPFVHSKYPKWMKMLGLKPCWSKSQCPCFEDGVSSVYNKLGDDEWCCIQSLNHRDVVMFLFLHNSIIIAINHCKSIGIKQKNNKRVQLQSYLTTFTIFC